MKQRTNKTMVSLRLRVDIIEFYKNPPDRIPFQLSSAINTLLRATVKGLQRNDEIPTARAHTRRAERRHSKYRIDTECYAWLRFYNINLSAFIEDMLQEAITDGTWKEIKRKRQSSHTR